MVNNSCSITEFNGDNIFTFYYQEKFCWIERDICQVLGYIPNGAGNYTAALHHLSASEARDGVHREILGSEALASLQPQIPEGHTGSRKGTASLAVLYLPGLVKLLMGSSMNNALGLLRHIHSEAIPKAKVFHSVVSSEVDSGLDSDTLFLLEDEVKHLREEREEVLEAIEHLRAEREKVVKAIESVFGSLEALEGMLRS